jgi:hypothetical protein
MNKCPHVKCDGCLKWFPSTFHINKHITSGKCTIPPPPPPTEEPPTTAEPPRKTVVDHYTEDREDFMSFLQLQDIMMDILKKISTEEFVLLRNEKSLRYYFVDDNDEMDTGKSSKTS